MDGFLGSEAIGLPPSPSKAVLSHPKRSLDAVPARHHRHQRSQLRGGDLIGHTGAPTSAIERVLIRARLRKRVGRFCPCRRWRRGSAPGSLAWLLP